MKAVFDQINLSDSRTWTARIAMSIHGAAAALGHDRLASGPDGLLSVPARPGLYERGLITDALSDTAVMGWVSAVLAARRIIAPNPALCD